jgi:hypothetical protein
MGVYTDVHQLDETEAVYAMPEAPLPPGNDPMVGQV